MNINVNNYTLLLDDQIIDAATVVEDSDKSVTSLRKNLLPTTIGCAFYHNFETLPLQYESFYPKT